MGLFLVVLMVLSKLKTSTELNKMASVERERPKIYKKTMGVLNA